MSANQTWSYSLSVLHMNCFIIIHTERKDFILWTEMQLKCCTTTWTGVVKNSPCTNLILLLTSAHLQPKEPKLGKKPFFLGSTNKSSSISWCKMMKAHSQAASSEHLWWLVGFHTRVLLQKDLIFTGKTEQKKKRKREIGNLLQREIGSGSWYFFQVSVALMTSSGLHVKAWPWLWYNSTSLEVTE